jgi:outer membrane protein W
LWFFGESCNYGFTQINPLNSMKRCLLSLLIVVFGYATAVAQTEKGKWSVGLQVEPFSLPKYNRQSDFFTRVSPTVGYFLVRNLEVGIGLPINYSKYGTNSGGSVGYLNFERTFSSIGLNPSVRYYLGSLKIKPYVGVAYSYSFFNQDMSFNNAEDISINGRKGSIIPSFGVSYFIKNKFGITAGIQQNWSQIYMNSRNWAGGARYGDSETTVSLGVQLLFGGKARAEK